MRSAHRASQSGSHPGDGDKDPGSYTNHPRVLVAKRKAEPEVTFRYVPRLEPGTYSAYCRSARVYRDRVFQRWVAALQFDVLADPGDDVLGRFTWFLNLGSKEKPNASRRSRYWEAWVKANGGPPQRQDRLSPRVFSGRMARVELGDTTKDTKQRPVAGDGAYSVVRDVKEWQTGFGGARARPSKTQDLACPSRGEVRQLNRNLKGGPVSTGPSKADRPPETTTWRSNE
jgi:hypothetical protein